MSEEDRKRWDARWAGSEGSPVEVSVPPAFAASADLLPTSGSALDVACGRGRTSVWLAQRGLEVWGVDISPVAIRLAEQHAAEVGVSQRTRFDVHDLDEGLPPGPPVDLVLCHLFRDPGLDVAMVERLVSGGILAVTVLSEVDAQSGRFRAERGELTAVFGHLDVLHQAEADGRATLVARRP